MIQDKTVSWQIPRAALSSSSSSSGSNYNESVKKIRRNSAPFTISRDENCELKYFSHTETYKIDKNSKKLEPDKKRRNSAGIHLPKGKRGSHSSQSSSTSNDVSTKNHCSLTVN